jgi:UDPglucose 6-dehydrogenase
MKIAVIGTGHIGLVTVATLALLGHEVSAVDSDAEKIDMLRRGEQPFFEPRLPELVNEQVAAGRLAFEYEIKAVLPGAEVVRICVGTPANPRRRDRPRGRRSAALDIAREADDGVVVVGKSTVPAGTADRIRSTFERVRPDATISCSTRSSSARVPAFTIPLSPADYWSGRTTPRGSMRCGTSTSRCSRRGADRAGIDRTRPGRR